MKKEIKVPENSRIYVENGFIRIEINKQKFKRGDILECEYGSREIVIFKEMENDYLFTSYASTLYPDRSTGLIADRFELASEESKQKLFNNLKLQGKQWNAEKFEIESIMFHEGDLVICWDYNKRTASICVYKKTYSKDFPHETNSFFYKNAVKFESIEQYKKIVNDD